MNLGQYLEGGLRVFPIFQQGNEEKGHFSRAQGKIDARLAGQASKDLYVVKRKLRNKALFKNPYFLQPNVPNAIKILMIC